MRVLVGTSGWSYAPWKGSFYPEKLPAAKMLAHYAGQLGTVEVNNTFYRMPKPEQFTKWAEETPEGFTFAVKSTRRITHDKKLLDVEDPVRWFFETTRALGNRQGPVLFQLPPIVRKDLPRLEAFLTLLRAVAPEARAAFEFRHDSWFADDVYAALRAGGAALCLSESEELATPVEATAGFGYLRLRRQDYAEAEIAAWADRIRAQPWQDTFVYFKHEDEGKGPRLAGQLLKALAA